MCAHRQNQSSPQFSRVLETTVNGSAILQSLQTSEEQMQSEFGSATWQPKHVPSLSQTVRCRINLHAGDADKSSGLGETFCVTGHTYQETDC